MSKRVFILILLLLAFNYLENQITNSFLNKDILLVIQWLWCFIGFLTFSKNANNPLNIRKNRRYFLWFILLMFISTISPYLEYNQPIFATLISQRANYSIFTLIVLLYIHPTENDIFYSVKILSILSIFIFLYPISNPDFFLTSDQLIERSESNSTDIGAAASLPGFPLILIHFFFVSYKLITDKMGVIQNLFLFLILSLIIFLIQNRQSLIITTPIFTYTIFKSKNKYNKYVIPLIVITFVGYFLSDIQYIIESLINETNNQINNENYNRWQAIYIYLLEWKYNLFNIFFGHGIGSSNSKYTEILSFNNERYGAYYQDIGFLGVFFVYGSIFIILNYFLIFQGFLRKGMPYYLKFWCFGLIILPIFLNWGLMNNNAAVFFSLLFYLIIYNKQYNNENLSHYHKL